MRATDFKHLTTILNAIVVLDALRDGEGYPTNKWSEKKIRSIAKNNCEVIKKMIFDEGRKPEDCWVSCGGLVVTTIFLRDDEWMLTLYFEIDASFSLTNNE